MSKINNYDSAGVSLRELIHKITNGLRYLKSKMIVILIVGFISGLLGFFYAWSQKPLYTARLTFALEEEKSSVGSGLAGALGLAGSLGIDIDGSAGGAFSGANLIELMKSRTLVQKALMYPIQVEGKQYSMADYLISLLELNKKKNADSYLSPITFTPYSNPDTFTVKQDSVINILWEKVVNPRSGFLTVVQKDKKISIITVQSKSQSEVFSKIFTETIAKVVSEFYIETKSQKAKQNLQMLQKQTDSVKSELNNAITGVAIASDQTYNLNPALNVRRTPSLQRQIDVQTNTAVLTQLIPNLEMAKLSLRKETPLIQIIDKPVFPLEKDKPSKLLTMLFASFVGSFLTSLILISKKIVNKMLLEY